MTTIKFRAPLVGMRFRPPADTVVSLLSVGTILIAQRQPDNPYDENAVQILIEDLSIFPDIFEAARIEMEERGEAEALAMWHSSDQHIVPLHLGFVAREKAATMAETLDAVGGRAPAKLFFSASGAPEVEIKCEVAVPCAAKVK